MTEYKINKKSSSHMQYGKKLVEYLAQNKTNQHSELVLEFGIEVAQNDANELADVANAGLIEEFFLAAIDLKQIDWA